MKYQSVTNIYIILLEQICKTKKYNHLWVNCDFLNICILQGQFFSPVKELLLKLVGVLFEICGKKYLLPC